MYCTLCLPPPIQYDMWLCMMHKKHVCIKLRQGSSLNLKHQIHSAGS